MCLGVDQKVVGLTKQELVALSISFTLLIPDLLRQLLTCDRFFFVSWQRVNKHLLSTPLHHNSNNNSIAD